MNHILVVDDEPSICEMLRMVLEAEGYPVKTARNGLEALQQIASDPPTVILLDRQMPLLDGTGVVDRLREQGQDVPVVGMTAAGHVSAWCAEIGAEACLGKPFDLAELLSVVKRVQRPASR